jgi:hypothetical protein
MTTTISILLEVVRELTKGEITYVGKAKFFEGPLPPDFKKNNPDTIAGILDSTTKKPDSWDGVGQTIILERPGIAPPMTRLPACQEPRETPRSILPRDRATDEEHSR